MQIKEKCNHRVQIAPGIPAALSAYSVLKHIGAKEKERTMKRQRKAGKGQRRWGALMLMGAALWMLARAGSGDALRQQLSSALEDWRFSEKVLSFQLGAGKESLEQAVFAASPALAAGTMEDLEEDSMAAEQQAELLPPAESQPTPEPSPSDIPTEIPAPTETSSENPEKTP